MLASPSTFCVWYSFLWVLKAILPGGVQCDYYERHGIDILRRTTYATQTPACRIQKQPLCNSTQMLQLRLIYMYVPLNTCLYEYSLILLPFIYDTHTEILFILHTISDKISPGSTLQIWTITTGSIKVHACLQYVLMLFLNTAGEEAMFMFRGNYTMLVDLGTVFWNDLSPAYLFP